jgi:hypothetical protein
MRRHPERWLAVALCPAALRSVRLRPLMLARSVGSSSDPLQCVGYVCGGDRCVKGKRTVAYCAGKGHVVKGHAAAAASHASGMCRAVIERASMETGYADSESGVRMVCGLAF